jgi:DNA repair exonuclease SbcCD nuclease subunit
MIIGADAHLKPETWARLPRVRGDSYFSLRQLTTIAEQHGATTIALLGDVFDSANPDAMSVDELVRERERAQARGISFLLIEGNHDAVNIRPLDGAETPTSWPAACRTNWYAQPQAIQLGPYLKGWCLDFQRAGKLGPALAAIPPDVSVLFAHQSWAEIQRVGIADGNAAMLPPHIRYVFTGDNHKHGVFLGHNGTASVTFYSPGSMSMQAMNEDPTKFVYLVDFSQAAPVVTPIPLLTRRFFKLQLATAPTALDDAITALEAAMAGEDPTRGTVIGSPLIRLSVPVGLAGVKERVLSRFPDTHVDIEAYPEEQIEVFVDPDAPRVAGFATLPAAVRELAVRGQIPTDVADDCVRLLAAEDKAAELALLRKEFEGKMKCAITP